MSGPDEHTLAFLELLPVPKIKGCVTLQVVQLKSKLLVPNKDLTLILRLTFWTETCSIKYCRQTLVVSDFKFGRNHLDLD